MPTIIGLGLLLSRMGSAIFDFWWGRTRIWGEASPQTPPLGEAQTPVLMR
jgi:hypothetical protein